MEFVLFKKKTFRGVYFIKIDEEILFLFYYLLKQMQLLCFL